MQAVEEAAAYYSTYNQVTSNKPIWALKALQLTDLTTLGGDDTPSNVKRLCVRAAHPFGDSELKHFDDDVRNKIHTAAVCVYPSRVKDAFESLQVLEIGRKIEIAAGMNNKKSKYNFNIAKIHLNYIFYCIICCD